MKKLLKMLKNQLDRVTYKARFDLSQETNSQLRWELFEKDRHISGLEQSLRVATAANKEAGLLQSGALQFLKKENTALITRLTEVERRLKLLDPDSTLSQQLASPMNHVPGSTEDYKRGE